MKISLRENLTYLPCTDSSTSTLQKLGCQLSFLNSTYDFNDIWQTLHQILTVAKILSQALDQMPELYIKRAPNFISVKKKNNLNLEIRLKGVKIKSTKQSSILYKGTV